MAQKGQLSEVLEEGSLGINNFLDLFLFFAFTLAVIIVSIPMGVMGIVGGVKVFMRYGFKKIPEDIFIRHYGKNAIEIIFVGMFSMGFSLWYLFVDKGGQLFNLCTEMALFFDW